MIMIYIYDHFVNIAQFYVSDPMQLEDERTRYQYFLQIKRDIYQGKLACPVYTLCLLASYIVQSM